MLEKRAKKTQGEGSHLHDKEKHPFPHLHLGPLASTVMKKINVSDLSHLLCPLFWHSKIYSANNRMSQMSNNQRRRRSGARGGENGKAHPSVGGACHGRTRMTLTKFYLLSGSQQSHDSTKKPQTWLMRCAFYILADEGIEALNRV